MAYGYRGQSLEEPAANPTSTNSKLGTREDTGVGVLYTWQHASKTFLVDGYQNSPKLKFLYHVYFDINPEAYVAPDPTPYYQNMLGILVREVKLPSYQFTTHQLNQYNRKRIVQTKLKYEPCNFSFHDDINNTVASMWAAYYTYYYNDGNNPTVVFNGVNRSIGLAPTTGGETVVVTNTQYGLRTQYAPSSALPNPNNWGYQGDPNSPTSTAATKTPFFNNITIFGMNRHEFLAYTLINPIITSFSHDTYNYDEGSGVMRNQMTVDYETVVYNEGTLDGQNPSAIISGFGLDNYYDTTLSPITKPDTNNYQFSSSGDLVSGPENGQVVSLQRPNILNPTPQRGPTTTQYATQGSEETPEIVTTASRIPDPQGQAFNEQYGQDARAQKGGDNFPSANATPSYNNNQVANKLAGPTYQQSKNTANTASVLNTSNQNPNNSIMFQAQNAAPAGSQVAPQQKVPLPSNSFGGLGG